MALKIFEHTNDYVSFVPRSAESVFLSRLHNAFSCGKLMLLTEIPEEDILAIANAVPGALGKYLPSVAPDCYVPAELGRLELYTSINARPIVMHEMIYEATYGSASLPSIGSIEFA